MYWVGPESKKSNFHQLFNSGGASSKTGAGGHLNLGIKLLPAIKSVQLGAACPVSHFREAKKTPSEAAAPAEVPASYR